MNTNQRLIIASPVAESNEWKGNGGKALMEMVSDEWYRLRVVIARADGKRVVVGVENDGNQEACYTLMVANDGVLNTYVPGNNAKRYYSVTGSSRLDLAIKCDRSISAEAKIVVEGQAVGIIKITEGKVTSATPHTRKGNSWKPNKPYYLKDLQNIKNNKVTKMDIVLSGSDRTINGEQWNRTQPLETLQYNEVQEWTISGSNAHPFHLHVYHMQVVGECGDHQIGEYYDTISSPDPCTVRFRTIGFGERVVMHCHVLLHEDDGMMSWVNVEPNNRNKPMMQITPVESPNVNQRSCYARRLRV